ncbi:MAG: ParB/RepB/Spo0J family partition protein [Pseudomonadota bacterium]
MTGRKKGLGRGLSALMNDAGLLRNDDPASESEELEQPEESAPVTEAAQTPGNEPDRTSTYPPLQQPPLQQPGVRNVSIARIIRNTAQPRRRFEPGQLDDLVASIQQKGVLQPILVRQISGEADTPEAEYQIVAGERRWRAAIKAGLTSIPIIVRELSDRDVLEIGVIENVQRADLNPLEEALAYERLISEFGRTQAEIATTIGKSRVHVANTVRLTGLTERARGLLLDGKITAGHARALLAAEDPDALAEAIIKNEWSVREAENWVKAERKPAKSSRRKAAKPSDITALEQRIQDSLGYGADIRHTGRGGEIRLKYNDLDHMEALLTRLGLMDG